MWVRNKRKAIRAAVNHGINYRVAAFVSSIVRACTALGNARECASGSARPFCMEINRPAASSTIGEGKFWPS